MIRVQRGIPLPNTRPRGLNGRRRPIYPWAQMQIGDSFLFPERATKGCYTAAKQASKSGKLFKVHRVDEGYRCWRLR